MSSVGRQAAVGEVGPRQVEPDLSQKTQAVETALGTIKPATQNKAELSICVGRANSTLEALNSALTSHKGVVGVEQISKIKQAVDAVTILSKQVEKACWEQQSWGPLRPLVWLLRCVHLYNAGPKFTLSNLDKAVQTKIKLLPSDAQGKITLLGQAALALSAKGSPPSKVNYGQQRGFLQLPKAHAPIAQAGGEDLPGIQARKVALYKSLNDGQYIRPPQDPEKLIVEETITDDDLNMYRNEVTNQNKQPPWIEVTVTPDKASPGEWESLTVKKYTHSEAGWKTEERTITVDSSNGKVAMKEKERAAGTPDEIHQLTSLKTFLHDAIPLRLPESAATDAIQKRQERISMMTMIGGEELTVYTRAETAGEEVNNAIRALGEKASNRAAVFCNAEANTVQIFYKVPNENRIVTLDGSFNQQGKIVIGQQSFDNLDKVFTQHGLHSISTEEEEVKQRITLLNDVKGSQVYRPRPTDDLNQFIGTLDKESIGAYVFSTAVTNGHEQVTVHYVDSDLTIKSPVVNISGEVLKNYQKQQEPEALDAYLKGQCFGISGKLKQSYATCSASYDAKVQQLAREAAQHQDQNVRDFQANCTDGIKDLKNYRTRMIESTQEQSQWMIRTPIGGIDYRRLVSTRPNYVLEVCTRGTGEVIPYSVNCNKNGKVEVTTQGPGGKQVHSPFATMEAALGALCAGGVRCQIATKALQTQGQAKQVENRAAFKRAIPLQKITSDNLAAYNTAMIKSAAVKACWMVRKPIGGIDYTRGVSLVMSTAPDYVITVCLKGAKEPKSYSVYINDNGSVKVTTQGALGGEVTELGSPFDNMERALAVLCPGGERFTGGITQPAAPSQPLVAARSSPQPPQEPMILAGRVSLPPRGGFIADSLAQPAAPAKVSHREPLPPVPPVSVERVSAKPAVVIAPAPVKTKSESLPIKAGSEISKGEQLKFTVTGDTAAKKAQSAYRTYNDKYSIAKADANAAKGILSAIFGQDKDGKIRDKASYLSASTAAAGSKSRNTDKKIMTGPAVTWIQGLIHKLPS